mmetsp:Transcript_1662/g.3131  ORF Transcript_1662/g.3131 Transcript_1662/m.3131 type:complete len:363 (-) Transcript_1662:250-1338(-)
MAREECERVRSVPPCCVEAGLQFDPDQAVLKVEVLSCLGLPVTDHNGYSDPFLKVSVFCEGHDMPAAKTSVNKFRRNLSPVFEETFTFSTFGLKPEDMYVTIAVWDWDLQGNEHVGQVVMRVADNLQQNLEELATCFRWYRLDVSGGLIKNPKKHSTALLFSVSQKCTSLSSFSRPATGDLLESLEEFRSNLDERWDLTRSRQGSTLERVLNDCQEIESPRKGKRASNLLHFSFGDLLEPSNRPGDDNIVNSEEQEFQSNLCRLVDVTRSTGSVEEVKRKLANDQTPAKLVKRSRKHITNSSSASVLDLSSPLVEKKRFVDRLPSFGKSKKSASKLPTTPRSHSSMGYTPSSSPDAKLDLSA